MQIRVSAELSMLDVLRVFRCGSGVSRGDEVSIDPPQVRWSSLYDIRSLGGVSTEYKEDDLSSQSGCLRVQDLRFGEKWRCF
jgi:hypothetical protein